MLYVRVCEVYSYSQNYFRTFQGQPRRSRRRTALIKNLELPIPVSSRAKVVLVSTRIRARDGLDLYLEGTEPLVAAWCVVATKIQQCEWFCQGTLCCCFV